jgi:hypothetical protein
MLVPAVVVAGPEVLAESVTVGCRDAERHPAPSVAAKSSAARAKRLSTDHTPCHPSNV